MEELLVGHSHAVVKAEYSEGMGLDYWSNSWLVLTWWHERILFSAVRKTRLFGSYDEHWVLLCTQGVITPADHYLLLRTLGGEEEALCTLGLFKVSNSHSNHIGLICRNWTVVRRQIYFWCSGGGNCNQKTIKGFHVVWNGDIKTKWGDLCSWNCWNF